MSDTTELVCCRTGCWHVKSVHSAQGCMIDCVCSEFLVSRETMPTDKQDQTQVPDDVFRAWVGMELQGGRGSGKTAHMILSAFAEALKGQKVLVTTPQGNVVMQLQPAAPEPEPEPEITFDDDPEFQIAERVRAVCAHCDLPFQQCKCLPTEPLKTKWIKP